MRRSTLLAVSLASAIAGAAVVLAVGAAAGWVGRDTTRTVVVTQPAPSAQTASVPAASVPAISGRFDAARIYALRAPGVVTIFSYFGSSSSPGTEAAQGSGFVVSPNGTILTNAHVITTAGQSAPGGEVRPAREVFVEFPDGDRVPARVVGWDVFDDVGVLRVDTSLHAVAPVPLGDSQRVTVGEPVAAIGSPLGNETSLATGVVSAVHRAIPALTVRDYDIVDAIQIDAPITHGSSGGPLLDAKGRVIGINAQIRSEAGSGNDAGVGFAIPISSARRSLREILRTGKVHYAFVGIKTETVTPSIARRFGLPVTQGALVADVTDDAPGARAGLRGGTRDRDFEGETVTLGGDVVVAVNGMAVRSADDLVRLVATRLRPGQRARFTIYRGGTRLVLPVVLGARSAVPLGG